MAERSLRVLHLIRATGISGAERQLIDLLATDRRWPGVDRELRFLLGRPFDLSNAARSDRGFSLTVDQMPHDLSPRLAAGLVRDFARYDLVHTHLVHADWHAFVASKRRRAAWVTTKHNHDSFRTRRAFRVVEKRVNENADLTIAISNSLARFVERTTSVAPAVVPYGYGGPLPSKAPPPRRHSPFRLLALGRHVHQKGYDTAIEAVAALTHRMREVSLTVAGDGPDRGHLEALARRLGVTRQIRFVGWVDDALPLLREHDLLVHPARWEGFGLVLLEAMASGLPVVGSTAGAVPEVLGDAAAALVPPDDPAELACAIEACLEGPARRQAASEAGQRAVLHRLSMDHAVERLRGLYEAVLAARGPVRQW